jgi:hypothetical protein
MSRILAECDLINCQWNINIDYRGNNIVDVLFSFENNLKNFVDLEFSIKVQYLSTTETVINWPANNKKYIQTDQQVLESTRLLLDYGKEYTLIFSAKNNNDEITKEIQLTVPLPKKPFQSWIWKNSKWQPPLDYPSDGQSYQWIEDLQNWQQFDES